MTKTCKTCGETKDEAEFHPAAYGKGRRPHCKACTSARRRAEYAEGTAGRGRDVSYGQVLKREYGLTLEDYNALLRKQAHRCAICRRPQNAVVRKGNSQARRLAVDHDHVTGTVRGLLCHRCNILVWALEDNHTTLDAIRRYVEEFRESFGSGAPL